MGGKSSGGGGAAAATAARLGGAQSPRRDAVTGAQCERASESAQRTRARVT